jgi:hypothetical protein
LTSIEPRPPAGLRRPGPIAFELDNEWIIRFPRRPEVEQWVEREIGLLPELAPTLPVAVPHFDLVGRNGLVCVGHRKIIGSPAKADLGERTGEDLARFLSALHSFRSSGPPPLVFRALTPRRGESTSAASARNSDDASSRCSR